MGIARMKVSGELIADLLRLPAGTEVFPELNDAYVSMLVEHDSIPQGALEVTAEYRKIHGVTVFDKYVVTKSRTKADAQ